jgi:hypothetical protein
MRCVISENPTRSANATVSCRRSGPREAVLGDLATSGGAAGAEALGGTSAGFFFDVPSSLCPHSWQNFAVETLTVAHSGHGRASFSPHSWQNFADPGLECPHPSHSLTLRGYIVLQRGKRPADGADYALLGAAEHEAPSHTPQTKVRRDILPPMSTTHLQCPCGATKVAVSADPMSAFYCHCDDDQAVHGAPMVGVALFPADSVEVSGQPVEWTLRVTPRTNCGACGARMTIRPPGAPFVGVVSSLLPPEMFKPQWHHQCQFASIKPNDDLPKYHGYPVAMGGPNDDLIDW